MSLQKLLELNDKKKEKEQKKVEKEEPVVKKTFEQRIQENLPEIRNMIAFYREYPDLFIDFLKGDDETFNLYFYQRVFLRACARHRFVYATFPRGFSKSFLSIMVLMIRCTLFPGSQLFITTGGKEQAASITMEKVELLCRLLPRLRDEIRFERGGGTKAAKDVAVYKWKNGSMLGNLAAKESSRGQRRHGGLIEEVILVDPKMLNEVVLPTTNVDRVLPDGSKDPKEVVNKSQIYIRNSFSKNRL